MSNHGNISKNWRINSYLEKLNSKIQRKNYYLKFLKSKIWRKNHYLDTYFGSKIGRKNHYLVVEFSSRFSHYCDFEFCSGTSITLFILPDVYLLGGYNNTIIFSDIWRIDLTDLQWRKMPQALEKPVYFHDSVLTDVSIQFM